MVKNIVLPTDFSDNSWNAICYAIDLFKYDACEFHVLHTYTPTTFANDNMLTAQFGQMQMENLKENSHTMLKALSKKIAFKDTLPHHNFHYISEFNLILDAINALVEKTQANLIVMGTKGATDTIDVLLGGNTINVMEEIRSCPVLMIPKEARFKKPKEIVFPTGYDTTYNKEELEHLIAIAKNNKATIHVLYIGAIQDLDTAQQENKKVLEKLLSNVSHSFHNIEDAEVHKALNIFVQSRDSDMIAFLNKKHGFFETIFKRPMVKELGYHSKLPVLAMHI